MQNTQSAVVVFDKTISTSDLVESVQGQLDKGAHAYKTMINLAEVGNEDQALCDMQALMNPECGLDQAQCKDDMEFAVTVSSQHLAELAIRATSDKDAKALFDKVPAYYALFTGRKGTVDLLDKPEFSNEIAVIFGKDTDVKDCSQVEKTSMVSVMTALVNVLSKK